MENIPSPDGTRIMKNNDKIIALAKECGVPIKKFLTPEGPIRLEQSGATTENVIRFAESVRREALEEAAKMCDQLGDPCPDASYPQDSRYYEIATKIRALITKGGDK